MVAKQYSGGIFPLNVRSGENGDPARWRGESLGFKVRENSLFQKMLRISVWLVLPLMMGGCTLEQYAKQADKAAYTTLAGGQAAALGQTLPFDVNYDPYRPAYEDPQVIRVGEKVIHLGDGERVTLTLDECLEIAFRGNRGLQNREEAVYASALDLANTRRSWNVPLFSGPIEASIEREKTASGPKADHSAAASIGSDATSSSATITQRFVNGGVLTLAALLDWSTNFSGETAASSLLRANFTQPLLKGAWRGFAYEDQYRLERDFLFLVFDYERFRQGFAVTVLTAYYSVLQRRDQLENQRANIARLKETVALTRVKVEGGQVSRIQEDQARQDLLNAQIVEEKLDQSYRNELDQFKIDIGLPLSANVRLDYPQALEDLAKAGLQPIEVTEDDAVIIALFARPDVLTERAKVRDADRDVELAADDFLPQLDVEFDISAPSTPDKDFSRIRFHNNRRFAQARFKYNLDQTDNRDAYRLALIGYDRARRDLDEFLDGVRLDVRRSYRDLMQSRKSYGLQVESVAIALRRRKLASLQQKEGEASARDVLEAEDALRNAQNGLTGELVDYTTTRLSFLATLGLIEVDSRGQYYEREEPFIFERIRRLYPYVGE